VKAHQWSASKVDLGLLCLYWARADVPNPKRIPSVPAARGIAVHKACENYNRERPLPALDEEGAALWATLKGWLDGSSRPTSVELPLLYDAENDMATTCEMGKGDRDYLNVGPMTIPMRLDLVWTGDDLHPAVVDLKTGSRSGTVPAAQNLQLATQGLAFARYWGEERIDVGLVFPMKTKIHVDWHTLDADALDAHAGLLHSRLRMLPTAEPVKGSHCWRCPIGPHKDHRSTCPAWANEEAAE
jgi:hypothetical protein